MVICKYFLRGVCRFGESCKNEHAYTETATSSVMRKKGEIDINLLIKSVSNDMDKAEKGNQWPLSCYGPFQAKPCFPGFEDKCFEEIRLGIYEAEKTGTVEQYKQQLTQLLHEARMKMRSLQNPTAEASHVLQELYSANSAEHTANVFTNTNSFSNSQIQSNSVFNTGNAAKNIFNNQTSPAFSFAAPENKSIFSNTVFAQPSQQNYASGGGIFNGNQIQQQQQQQNQSFQATNIFKNANTAYNQSIFSAQQPATNQSPFVGAQPTQTTANIFMQNNSPPNPFKQNIQTPATGQSPFGPGAVQQPFLGQTPNQPTFASTATNQAQFGPQFASSNTNQTPFASTAPNQVFAQAQPSFVANQSPFAATTAPVNQSPFAATTAPINQSPFAATAAPQNQSPFAATAASQNQSPFAATAAPQNQSPFAATANQSPFVPLNTMQSVRVNQSPFTPAPWAITENRSIFAQQASIGKNNQANTLEHSRSIFGTPQSTILSTASQTDDPTVYSKLETLSENDVKSFEASTFQFGKIPDKPPTLQMCS